MKEKTNPPMRYQVTASRTNGEIYLISGSRSAFGKTVWPYNKNDPYDVRQAARVNARQFVSKLTRNIKPFNWTAPDGTECIVSQEPVVLQNNRFRTIDVKTGEECLYRNKEHIKASLEISSYFIDKLLSSDYRLPINGKLLMKADESVENWERFLVVEKYTLKTILKALESNVSKEMITNKLRAELYPDRKVTSVKVSDDEEVSIFARISTDNRLLNCLRSENILTITDLMTYDDEKFRRIPNLGPKSLRRLQDIYREFNLPWTY